MTEYDKWEGQDYAPMTAPDGRHRSAADLYTPADWRKLWSGQHDEADWLYEPLLERGTITALFGAPDAGKSLLTLEVLLGLARRGVSVLLIDEENRAVDLVERLAAMGANPDELDTLHCYNFSGLPPLDTMIGGAHLAALVERNDAELVVLDTISRVIEGSENDADTYLKLFRYSLAPLKAQGVTILRIDHPGKDATRGQRGSSAKGGDCDVIWELSVVTKGRTYQLFRRRNRTGHGDGGELITLTRVYEPLRHLWSCPQDSAETRILRRLDDLHVPADAGRGRCRQALTDAGFTTRNAQLESAIRLRKQRGAAAGQLGQQALPGPTAPSPLYIEGAGGQVPDPADDEKPF